MKYLFLVAVLVGLPLSAQAKKLNFKPGQWETTMKVEGMNMPPTTMSQCLTKKDLVPQMNQPGQECKTEKLKQKGNIVEWIAVCTQQGQKAKSKGKITYSGTSYSGTIQVTTGGMTMKMSMKGKRTGPCKKK